MNIAPVFLLLSVVLAGCQITGNIVVADDAPLQLTVTDVKTSLTDVTVEWRTNKMATSTFQLGDHVEVFDRGTKFSKNVRNLEPSRLYYYQIKACDRDGNCQTQGSQFATTIQPPKEAPQVTAAAVADISQLRDASKYAGNVLFILVAFALFVMSAKIGVTTATALANPAERTFLRHTRKSRKLTTAGRHHEATELYNKARETYMKLDEKKKVKHYDTLMNLYDALARYNEASEAHGLAEKFSNGNISREEIDRLGELLSK